MDQLRVKGNGDMPRRTIGKDGEGTNGLCVGIRTFVYVLRM